MAGLKRHLLNLDSLADFKMRHLPPWIEERRASTAAFGTCHLNSFEIWDFLSAWDSTRCPRRYAPDFEGAPCEKPPAF